MQDDYKPHFLICGTPFFRQLSREYNRLTPEEKIEWMKRSVLKFSSKRAPDPKHEEIQNESEPEAERD